MNILTDFHHQSLLDSLVMLFEVRLGHKLFRPIGMDWYTEGFWKLNDLEDTAKQYLLWDHEPADGTPILNPLVGTGADLDGKLRYFTITQPDGKLQKAVTLGAFKHHKFDVIIASLPQHIEPFKELIRLYQPHAKLIYQIGNQWQVNPKDVKNVLASAKVQIPTGLNGVIYHQEFNTQIFHYEPPARKKKIYSFVNCLNTADLFRKDWELFNQLEAIMPEWEFKSFGGQCRDGWCNTPTELAEKIREADFIFHCKSGGDGYGHVIHNAAASGRLLITRHSDYFDKLAQPLIDQSNSILVDGRSARDIAAQIEEKFADEKTFEIMSEAMRKTFDRNVNFDREAGLVKKFMEELI